MGGMVLETNMNEIVAQVELQNRMEKSEVSPLAILKDHVNVFLHLLAKAQVFRERTVSLLQI